MIKRKRFFTVLLIALLLSACIPEVSRECPLPSEGFSESDLVGTWSADQGDNTIIVRGDGRYKQIMCVDWQEFKYESDWLPWHVTYSDEGLPYLHLKGFLMCAYWHQIDCRTGETGIELIEVGDTKDIFADATYWYDSCQQKWVDTPGEGVFRVFGVSADHYYPRGIDLVAFTKSPGRFTGPLFIQRESPATSLIFADGFESGDLSAWSALVVDGVSEVSHLQVSPAAAWIGQYGMQVAANGNTARYVRDDTPDRELLYRARFFFAPNAVAIPDGSILDIFAGYDTSGESAIEVFRVQLRFGQLRFSRQFSYQVRTQALKDTLDYISTPWYSIDDTKHSIEIHWITATAPNMEEGLLNLYIDGMSKGDLGLLELGHNTQRIDEVRLGKVAGEGASGTLYFDAFDSGRSAIGCASW